MNDTSEMSQCLHPDCVDTVECRGLCNFHYQRAWRRVREGRTTWETLEQAGRVREAVRTRRRIKRRDPWFDDVSAA